MEEMSGCEDIRSLREIALFQKDVKQITETNQNVAKVHDIFSKMNLLERSECSMVFDAS